MLKTCRACGRKWGEEEMLDEICLQCTREQEERDDE